MDNAPAAPTALNNPNIPTAAPVARRPVASPIVSPRVFAAAVLIAASLVWAWLLGNIYRSVAESRQRLKASALTPREAPAAEAPPAP